jgi:hypothetical protein
MTIRKLIVITGVKGNAPRASRFLNFTVNKINGDKVLYGLCPFSHNRV